MKSSNKNSFIATNETEIEQNTEVNTKLTNLLIHDLRGPFGTVIGLLSLVKIYIKEGRVNELDSLIDMTHKSAIQGLKLLDELAAWAMEQNDGIKFKPAIIDIKKLLVDEVNYIEAAAKLKNIMVIHDIELEKHILADFEMVKSVVRNLINNALKFSFEKGEIIVSLEDNNSGIEISIKDTGKGISLEKQKDLFMGLDFHATKGTSQEKGTGRGLFMCKEFIDQHGGEIRVESVLGKGSEFKFTLPHLPYVA